MDEMQTVFGLSPSLFSQPCRFRRAVKSASFPPGEAERACTNSPWCIPIGILRTAPDPSGAMRRLSFALSSCTPFFEWLHLLNLSGEVRTPKNFPHPLWNVETGSVEKSAPKNCETWAVDKLLFLTKGLWIKSPREICAFGTFPHKLLLLPLLLPKPIYR